MMRVSQRAIRRLSDSLAAYNGDGLSQNLAPRLAVTAAPVERCTMPGCPSRACVIARGIALCFRHRGER